MVLSSAQLATLKTDILADGALAAIPRTSDGYALIAAAYSAVATPDFWVWRTNVTRADIYHTTSVDATTWNWSTYKAQSVPEQNAWVQIFMGDLVSFALANVRAGVAAIFTGSQAQTDQRTHCLAIGRRKATRGEKLFATGTGSTAVPAVMATGGEGSITPQNVEAAFS